MKKLITLAASLATLTGVSHGAALSLDGVDDWVAFGGAGVPTGSSAFTIGAWINPTSIPTGGGNGGTMTFWGTQGPANTANGWRLRGEDGTRHFFWGNDHDENIGGGSVLGDTTGPNGDGWHHFAVTYDGTTTTQYLNGAQLGATRAAGAANVAAANYRIGSRIDAEFFHGLIDEVSIWNVPLDAATIGAAYNLPINATDPSVSPFLVAYWDFENGLADVAGGDNGGVANGGALIDAGANAPIPEPSAGIFAALGALLMLRRRRR